MLNPRWSEVARRARRTAVRAFGSPLVLEAVRLGRERLRGGRGAPDPTAPVADTYAPVDRPPGAVDGALETLEDEVHQICFVEGHYPQGWPRHEGCPCCDARERHPLFEKYGMSHALCASCGFVFLDPYPPDALLERLYNAAYYPGVRRFVELPKARAGHRGALFSFPDGVLQRIIAHARTAASTGAWLEVGGGLGHFAHLIKETLPGWRVVLNDMNRDSQAFAAQVYGLEVIGGALESTAFDGQQFDVISMMAALEHVPQPLALLTAMVQRLRPGGFLVIGVPRFSPLNRLISHDASPSVTPPYHVSHFDEHTLAKLFQRVPQLDAASAVTWVDGDNAFRLIDLVKTWPYWRIEVPTVERDAPRSAMVRPYPPRLERQLEALAAADATVTEVIGQLDGGMYLTMIARRAPA